MKKITPTIAARTNRRESPAVFVALTLLLIAPGTALGTFSVTGTIKDFNGDPLPFIYVELWDHDNGGVGDDDDEDDLLATGYANSAGSYSFEVGAPFGNDSDGPDLYLRAEWRFTLSPSELGANPRFNNSEVILLERAQTFRNCGQLLGSTKFLPSSGLGQGGVTVNHNVTIDLVGKDLTMGQEQAFPDEMNSLWSAVFEPLTVIDLERGNVPWSVDYNVEINIIKETSIGVFCDDTGVINIGEHDIPRGGSRSAIFHEIGHLVQWHLYDMALPHAPFDGMEHKYFTESDPVFATKEAFGCYIGEFVDVAVNNDDSKNEDCRDNGILSGLPRNSNWRGDEQPLPDARTGLDGNTFESGENVEGAIAGFWFELPFDNVFRVIAEDHPRDVFEFCIEYVRNFVSGSEPVRTMYSHMHRHGIVFNRVRFATEAFEANEPSDEGPSADGNIKTIDGMLFLRGKVEAHFENVEAVDLGVRKSVNNKRVRVGFKPSTPGTDQGPGFTLFTDPVEFDFFSSSIEIDTREIGVGETDLVVVGENVDGYTDFPLTPTWDGDGNPRSDSDERYLKLLGAWYDKDRDPMTEDDGKVVIDNVPPKVKNFKP